MLNINTPLVQSTPTVSRNDGVIWVHGQRFDGWQNLLTGLGMQERDKRLHTMIAADQRLTENELNLMYSGDGLAKRVIDLPVYEMLRKGFSVEGDTENNIQKEFKRIGGKKALQKLLRWGALHGGSIAVMLINDGRKLDKPLNENAIRNIEGFRVYDRWRVTWDQANVYDDPANKNYGEIEKYTISPLTGAPFRVHESRLLIDFGVDVPDIIKIRNNWWGDSELKAPYERIRAMASVYAGVEHIVEDFVQAALTIKNLQSLIATGQESLIIRRLHLMDMSRHIMNTVLLDENETYAKHSTTIAGLPDTVDRFTEAVSSVTGIPVTLLMGRAPAGLNATGESDIRLWYDKVASKQEEKVLSHIERLTYLIMLQKDGPFKGKELKDYQVIMNPLWQMDDKEVAELRKSTAETDALYIQNGVLLPEEVAISRFGGATYSMDMVIDESLHEIKEEDEEPPSTPPPSPPPPQNGEEEEENYPED